MQPIKFPQQTHTLAENQPQYEPLPVHVGSTDAMPMTCCFQLSTEELAQINESGGVLWLTQLTFGESFQPVRLSTLNPFD